ncbi:class E sortase [uncultured Corynebacterium sp.]|uniref:class E sortase n=1 Tax=uncultured Corynebacterium sp. TaxID=159447 RepID=UPI0025E58FE6|nr:class E sortase [uncultured Corynebacterium sp.]
MGKHRRQAKTRLDPISVFGEILITFGVVALLFGFWDVFWTDIQSGREQAAVAHQLDEQWDEKNPRPLTEPAEGTAFARLFIPSFGSDFNFSVVKGVADGDLSKGPGHYQDSQAPGQPGNFAMAGHRVGRGSPFNDLGLLKTCDSVVVETAGSWNIYRVLPIDAAPGNRKSEAEKCMSPELAQKVSSGEYAGVNGRYITTPNDINVINPIPGQSRIEVHPDDAALLTMTTCHPQFSNKERMIVHAALVRSESKKDGKMPKELTEGA